MSNVPQLYASTIAPPQYRLLAFTMSSRRSLPASHRRAANSFGGQLSFNAFKQKEIRSDCGADKPWGLCSTGRTGTLSSCRKEVCRDAKSGNPVPAIIDNMLDTGAAVGFPGQAHALPKDALSQYLSRAIEAFNSSEDLRIQQFKHGQSNPTYLLQNGHRKYVLRKKPPGKVLASAHAVEREYQVLAALRDTNVPVPRALCLATDSTIIGTPFYVMEHVQGRIFTDPSCPELSPAERRQVYQAFPATLAALHSVRPADVGLLQFGRAGGYAKRQVWRWAQQYKSQLLGAPMPEMMALIGWLQSHIPAEDSDPSVTRISHGDFRLDNLVIHPTDPGKVLAILDWELSTLGHPFADLAYSAMPYHFPAGFEALPSLGDSLPEGIPTEAEYVAMYCKARSIPPPEAQTWSFFMALSLFRAAAILAGVGARAKLGNASSERAAVVGSDEVVQFIAQKALEVIDGSSSAPPAQAQPSTEALCAREVPVSAARPEAAPNSGRGKEYQTSSWPEAPKAATSARADTETEALCARRSTHHSASSSQTGSAPATGLTPSRRVRKLLELLRGFMAEHVYPAEHLLEELAQTDKRWTIHPKMEEMKAAARAQGLWNLWISPNLADCMRDVVAEASESGLLGAGLSNLEYAFLSEQMGRVVFASEVFNCSAPDTGNMEVLARYGTVKQKKQWLLPLLCGQIRSCFAMTEPAVASSDATNIQSSIKREGGSYILNGHKWWASGAMDPRCQICIFMGKTDPSAATHKQQSMILVPMAAPGVRIVRPLTVFGYDDAPHGHAELMFENVRMPEDCMLLGEGRGFEIAQGRLGPGRLHHCMRAIGMGERAVEAMVERGLQRTAFKRRIAEHGGFQQQLARARVRLDAARLTVLDAAHALDLVGNKQARGKIAAAKVLAPSTVLEVLDISIQAHGGGGVSDDFPLARLWAGARTLRLADGPDDVHLIAIARLELGKRMSKL